MEFGNSYRMLEKLSGAITVVLTEVGDVRGITHSVLAALLQDEEAGLRINEDFLEIMMEHVVRRRSYAPAVDANNRLDILPRLVKRENIVPIVAT